MMDLQRGQELAERLGGQRGLEEGTWTQKNYIDRALLTEYRLEVLIPF